MSYKVSWRQESGAVSPTGFLVERSDDNGRTYSTLTTVTNEAGSANYNKLTRRWFYSDAAGSPGSVYRVTALSGSGNSSPSFTIAPPAAPPSCLLVGYLVSPSGTGAATSHVYISAESRQTLKSTSGVVGYGPTSLGVTKETISVLPSPAGVWQAQVVRGALVRISIPSAEFEKIVVVPDEAGPVNVAELPSAAERAFALFPDVSAPQLTLPTS